jgi:lysine-specific permease
MTCGFAMSKSGPGGALVSFPVLVLLVYFLICGLAEIAPYWPISGSFPAFSERFGNPGLTSSPAGIYVSTHPSQFRLNA